MNRFTYAFLMLILVFSCSKKGNVEFQYDRAMTQVGFAVSEIEKAHENLPEMISIVVSFKLDTALTEQSYQIKSAGKSIQVSGGDETGLMYGGIQLAEMIAIQKAIPELPETVEEKPFIKERGLKFNIPLDIRTPSYQDAGDAAQNNILEMWNMDFWKSYLDMMARNRYNVLTMWNPHPFPSML